VRQPGPETTPKRGRPRAFILPSLTCPARRITITQRVKGSAASAPLSTLHSGPAKNSNRRPRLCPPARTCERSSLRLPSLPARATGPSLEWVRQVHGFDKRGENHAMDPISSSSSNRRDGPADDLGGVYVRRRARRGPGARGRQSAPAAPVERDAQRRQSGHV